MVTRTSLKTICCFLAIVVFTTTVAWGQSQYNHDKFQTTPCDITRSFTAFVVSFDSADDNDGDGDPDAWGLPEWVAYEIHRVKQPLGKGPKRPAWRTDKALSGEGIAPKDNTYKNSGYQRGHMCMKQLAFRMGAKADNETFTLLNACPQLGTFNNGSWKALEMKTGEWADKFDAVWVVCGPIITNHKPTQWIGDPGEMHIPVPDAFFKIVIRETNKPNRPDILAFIFPHKKTENKDMAEYLTTVNEIESATGLDFLTVLPDAIEEKLESIKATTIWN